LSAVCGFTVQTDEVAAINPHRVWGGDKQNAPVSRGVTVAFERSSALIAPAPYPLWRDLAPVLRSSSCAFGDEGLRPCAMRIVAGARRAG